MAVLHVPRLPIFNQASKQPKNGARLTGMDIGELVPHACLLSALICFIAIMMVGGAESAPPQPF